uniref:Uncharacterized protein n=1 Tax=Cannabis sativa TaxID=3483 RepID=A0A803PX20_CANSA
MSSSKSASASAKKHAAKGSESKGSKSLLRERKRGWGRQLGVGWGTAGGRLGRLGEAKKKEDERSGWGERNCFEFI